MAWDPIAHYQDVSVAEHYDQVRFNRLSGRVFNAVEKYNIHKAFKDVPLGSLVLDLPCGTGRLAEVLLDDGFTVIGVDISAPMLEVAKRRLNRFGLRFEARVEDAIQLANKEQKRYHAALCARVLMHFPLEKQIEFLRSVTVLTRARVVFTHSLNTRYQRFRRKIKRLLRHPASVGYPVTDGELRQLLAGAGLKEIRRLRPMPLLTEEIIVIAEPT